MNSERALNELIENATTLGCVWELERLNTIKNHLFPKPKHPLATRTKLWQLFTLSDDDLFDEAYELYEQIDKVLKRHEMIMKYVEIDNGIIKLKSNTNKMRMEDIK